MAVEQFQIAISPGEFIDKLTILEIKKKHILAPEKLANIEHELCVLTDMLADQLQESDRVSELRAALQQVNQALWNIEDSIRDCERENNFGEEFIELARSVYRQNDKRADIKMQINKALGSILVEEKSYQPYD